MANELHIKLITDISQSTKNVEQFTKATVDSVNKVSNSFNNLQKHLPTEIFKGAFAADIAAKGVDVLVGSIKRFIGFIEEGVESAAKEEAALAGLSEALRANGVATQENIALSTNFAEQLERTTKFSSEATLEAQSLLASLTGLSGEGLIRATQAAADLSTVLRIDLQSAAQKLAKASQGADEQFARLGIRFQKGSTDAQTFQNILSAVENQLGGRAQSAANTFAAIARNAVQNISKAFGFFITQNPAVIAAIKTITSEAFSLVDTINKNSGLFGEFITRLVVGFVTAGIEIVSFGKAMIAVFVSIAPTFEPIVSGFNAILVAFSGVKDSGIEAIFLSLGNVLLGVNLAVGIVIQSIKAIGAAVISLVAPIATTIDRLVAFSTAVNNKDLKTGLAVFTNFGNEIKQSFLGPLKDSEDGFKDVVKSFSDGNKKLEQGFKRGGEEAQMATDKFLALTEAIGSKSVEKQISVTIQENIGDKLIKTFKQIGQAISSLNLGEDIGVGIAANLKRGAAGAQAVFGQVIDRVAKALENIPVVGWIAKIVAELLKFLAQGKELVVQQATEFINEADKIPAKIFEAIPAFIRVLFEKATTAFAQNLIKIIPTFLVDLVGAIIDGIGMLVSELLNNLGPTIAQFIVAIIKAIVGIVTKIISSLPDIIKIFISLMYTGVPKIVGAFISELIKNIPGLARETAVAFVQAFKEAATGFGQQGENIGKEVGGFFGGVGDFLGFQDGGRVPDLAQFNNDGGIARVSAGEQILNKDLSGELQRFLAQNQGGNQSQAVTVNLMLGERELASVLLDLNRQGFRTA